MLQGYSEETVNTRHHEATGLHAGMLAETSADLILVTCPFCFQNGIDDVKTHKWFKCLDWDAAFQRKLKVCC